MTVRELIEELNHYPQDELVYSHGIPVGTVEYHLMDVDPSDSSKGTMEVIGLE